MTHVLDNCFVHICWRFAAQKIMVIAYRSVTQQNNSWGPQGFWGSGEKGYLFSGSWGALLIILGELGIKHILLGI